MKQMDINEIDIIEFCEQVCLICDGKKARIVPDQVIEAVGGVANIFLSKLLSKRESKLRFETYKLFASKTIQIGLDDIIHEIKNCTGISKRRSIIVLTAMEKTVQNNFKRYEILKPGEPLLFKPLGYFEVMDFNTSSYHVTYTDPAANYYEKFLGYGCLNGNDQ